MSSGIDPSTIDVTQPPAANPTTSGLRSVHAAIKAQFEAAKTEIEALQAGQSALEQQVGDGGLVPETRTVAGHPLSADVVLAASDVGLGNLTNAAQVLRSEMGAGSGVATLDAAGKIPSAQLPALAITAPHVVASEAEQLALDAQEGDVAIRTDTDKNYIHNGGTTGTMTDWTQLLTPAAPVQSVNGQTGNVSLGASDVGAAADQHASSHVTGDDQIASFGTGSRGLVPAPTADDATAGKVLSADGTWKASGGGTGVLGRILADVGPISTVTTEVIGFSLPAGFLQAGTVLHYVAEGVVTSSSECTLELYLDFDSGFSTLCYATLTGRNGASAAPFTVEAYLTCRSTGANGVLRGVMTVVGDETLGPFTAKTRVLFDYCTLNTGSAHTAGMQAKTDGAGTSLSFHQAFVEVL